jgi:hypothetical protein
LGYTQNLAKAAKRHLLAGQVLYANNTAGKQPSCKAVAGYLFGISGELAIKEMMRSSGMKPLSEQERRNDPFYAHFPELKSLLRDNVHGRLAGLLRKYAEDSSLFQYWETNMRYAPTDEIRASWIIKWLASANKLVEEMAVYLS